MIAQTTGTTIAISESQQEGINMHRRDLMKAGGLLITASALTRSGMAQESSGLYMPPDSCKPTVRLTAGPYFTLDSLRRPDIREDRVGVPLRLTFTVVDDYYCTPIEGAVVDVWHSDAEGIYSGVVNNIFDNNTMRLSGQQVDTRDRTSFLRGHQIADSNGRVEFTTIYPGWYSGRLPHIHVRALFPGAEQWSAFFTQLFLPPDIDRFVYTEEPYRARGLYPITLERDLVLKGDAGALAKLTIPMTRRANDITGEMILAI
jgi:protocatechuate 3,4-dioxygenase beta subunit